LNRHGNQEFLKRDQVKDDTVMNLTLRGISIH